MQHGRMKGTRCSVLNWKPANGLCNLTTTKIWLCSRRNMFLTWGMLTLAWRSGKQRACTFVNQMCIMRACNQLKCQEAMPATPHASIVAEKKPQMLCWTPCVCCKELKASFGYAPRIASRLHKGRSSIRAFETPTASLERSSRAFWRAYRFILCHFYPNNLQYLSRQLIIGSTFNSLFIRES